MSEDHRLAVGQVCCDDRQRDFEILEAARFEYLLDEVAEAVIAGEAEAGDAPPSDVPEANRTAGGNDARERRAAGVGCAENASDATAGNIRDGDVILLEDLQNA